MNPKDKLLSLHHFPAILLLLHMSRMKLNKQFQGNIRKTWKELKSDDDFGDMTLASEDK